MKTYAYGFPRIGKNREFKKAVEDFWNNKISEKDMVSRVKSLEQVIESTYNKYVDSHPSGEMTFYDKMLDTALMLGVYPNKGFSEYFSLCRGKNALEMTKWFNTNYHYLVPEISSGRDFSCSWKKIEEKEKDNSFPYIIGGFTFLKLSKGYSKFEFRDILMKLVKPYKEIISRFKKVHIDEPALIYELSREEIGAVKEFYNSFSGLDKEIYLFTYYDSVDFLKELFSFPVKGIGLDFVHGSGNLEFIKKNGFPKDKILVAGVVDGRNVWRSEISLKKSLVEEISGCASEVMISNAGPLFHLPVSLDGEDGLTEELKASLSFAEERLKELSLLKADIEGKGGGEEWHSKLGGDGNWRVRERLRKLEERGVKEKMPYLERKDIHRDKLNLPLFPTTTIGSFPQTGDVRNMRSKFRKGLITHDEYSNFIKSEIEKLIKFQEESGLDVFVHGEFERTDMVEFFAEKLEGIAVTKNSWIISYGTRGYRPPIIFTDIERFAPMTTKEILYAQSLTEKPVKGMLTGPVTIIAWSYVREDIPLSRVAYQLALCLQDEIKDYIKGGIKIVQVDEPAFREKAPVKVRDWPGYFDWAVKSFNLAVNVSPDIQVHTHMCYSEFGEIIEHINRMDFDVISIEASRSRADILESFTRIDFNKQIGLGVWDIHSPAVPSREDIESVVEKALKIFSPENFWINPDCGLKTRKWDEVIPSLKNMVSSAEDIREKYQKEK